MTTVPGALRVLRGQLAHMREQGYEVHAVSSPEPLLEEIGQSDQIQIQPLTMAREIAPFRDLVSLCKLILLFLRLKPDVVHSHTPKAGMLAMIAAFVTRVPVRVYHIRGLRFVTALGFKRKLLKTCEWIACRLAHRVLCVSRSVRQVAIEEQIVSAQRIQVLLRGSHGIDAEGFFHPDRLPTQTRSATRQQWSIPEEATVIGFVGRLVRDKGISEFYEAFQLLKDDYPQLHYLIVGFFEEGDPLPGGLREKLEQESRIHLTGKQFNTPPLFAAMDVLCLPTYREGLPFVTLEAAAMELPIVATDIPGCIDAVENEVTGLLVEVANGPALSDGLAAYLSSPLFRREHGAAGRERVLRDFRPFDMWRATDAMYREMMGARKISIQLQDNVSANSVITGKPEQPPVTSAAA
ncbi:glycosyltransferase family 4 protein [Polystyrenella longa]|uniref:glycosyltransferase family 4 protein n=1 Tax=Polystyrenella longa TaxID=2528007 RepID=UPI0018D26373|nr:glycosyltransferase family 4 protein [Polystyrenella longa]